MVSHAATLEPPEISLTAAGDPVGPPVNPLILNSSYFELNGVNLSCQTKHVELIPNNKLQTATTFCSEIDYVGTTKWVLTVIFYQDFSTGSVFDTLNACYTSYQASGAPVPFKFRPYSASAASTQNRLLSGLLLPQPFEWVKGDAGALSEVQIAWSLQQPPTQAAGAVAATGATAGQPGYYTPSGATTPANLAALSGITANPTTAWTTGQYVMTADLTGNHWTGTAWAAGKA